MIRWFLGLLGMVYFRWPGAILGFVIGSVIDNMNAGKTYNRGGSIFGRTATQNIPAEFELKLLALASVVIKADGKVDQSELDYVRRYFVQAYGKERANTTFRLFNDQIKKSGVSAVNLAQELKAYLRYESRLQVLHFLFSVAKADGLVSESEVKQLEIIARAFGLNLNDFNSIKAMFFDQPDRAYEILEVPKTATDAEIKKAYRTMVKKYHPDKLQDMDEAYRKGAEEKFRAVQEAYERIQKERGL
ncbi:MAG: TerB family tellurite resistance protein [Flavobacteriaceae bacterium]|jgi:DnaJ like chaperone protein|nr:molecular chaperone DjiA [Flavobacteriaceae bacterium]